MICLSRFPLKVPIYWGRPACFSLVLPRALQLKTKYSCLSQFAYEHPNFPTRLELGRSTRLSSHTNTFPHKQPVFVQPSPTCHPLAPLVSWLSPVGDSSRSETWPAPASLILTRGSPWPTRPARRTGSWPRMLPPESSCKQHPTNSRPPIRSSYLLTGRSFGPAISLILAWPLVTRRLLNGHVQ